MATPDLLLWLLLAALVVDFLVDQGLAELNARHQPRRMPDELAGIFTDTDALNILLELEKQAGSSRA